MRGSADDPNSSQNVPWHDAADTRHPRRERAPVCGAAWRALPWALSVLEGSTVPICAVDRVSGATSCPGAAKGASASRRREAY